MLLRVDRLLGLLGRLELNLLLMLLPCLMELMLLFGLKGPCLLQLLLLMGLLLLHGLLGRLLLRGLLGRCLLQLLGCLLLQCLLGLVGRSLLGLECRSLLQLILLACDMLFQSSCRQGQCLGIVLLLRVCRVNDLLLLLLMRVRLRKCCELICVRVRERLRRRRCCDRLCIASGEQGKSRGSKGSRSSRDESREWGSRQSIGLSRQPRLVVVVVKPVQPDVQSDGWSSHVLNPWV